MSPAQPGQKSTNSEVENSYTAGARGGRESLACTKDSREEKEPARTIHVDAEPEVANYEKKPASGQRLLTLLRVMHDA